MSNYWTAKGYTVTIVSTSSFGGDILNGVKNYVRNNSAQYFLLVGDYSDPAWGGSLWNANRWPPIYQGYLQDGYPSGGNPTHNLIPTQVVPDPLPRNQNMAYFAPYWFLSDMILYGDTDDNGLPDKTVTRLPYTTASQYLNHIWNMEYYNDAGYPADSYQVQFFVGDVDHYEDGEGDLAVAMADSITSILPGYQYVNRMLESTYFDAYTRALMAAQRWNSDLELVIFASAMWNRYKPGNFFSVSAGFSMSMIYSGTWCPWVIGSSCDTGDEFFVMHPSYQETVLNRFLTASNKGAIGWAGPTAGTWQDANVVIAATIVHRIYEDPSRPVAESIRLALCDILIAYDPETHPDIVNTALSYAAFCDPLTPFLHANHVVAVDEQRSDIQLTLAQNRPNPFGGQTAIRFTLPQAGPVSLRVYDVAGRVVRTLINGLSQPGAYQAVWNGMNDDGRLVSQGIYFARLAAQGRELERKLVLMR